MEETINKPEETGREIELKYEVIRDGEYLKNRYGNLPELDKILRKIDKKIKHGDTGVIKYFNEQLVKYKEAPILKINLSYIYDKLGEKEKAMEILENIVKEHPDNIYGITGLAKKYCEKKEYEKMPELLGKTMKIEDLYPERKEFHLYEVMQYYLMAITYFLVKYDIKEAEERYKILEMIAPEMEETKLTKESIEGCKVALKNEEWEKSCRNVEVIPHEPLQITEAPIFIHKEIEQLYNSDMNMPHSIIEQILTLPIESLVKDMEVLLTDTMKRYRYFVDLNESEEKDVDGLFIAYHSLFFLAELKASESIEVLLQFLRQDEDFYEFWIADYLFEDMWEIVYQTGNGRLDVLKEFMKEPNLDLNCREVVCTAVSKIAIFQPERRQEALDWFKDLFNYYIENKDDEDLIDTTLTGFMICDLTDIKAEELINEIEQLYLNDLVDLSIIGDFADFKKEIEKDRLDKRKLIENIYDRYDKFLKEYINHDYDDEDDDKDEEDLDHDEEKEFDEYLKKIKEDKNKERLGIKKEYYKTPEEYNQNQVNQPRRNDACPCGSGKKYKKCCGR